MYDSSDRNIVLKTKSNHEKTVTLTFDDGPGKFLPEFLDVLHEAGVPATFFWLSRLLHPSRPWQRVLEEGHQIGTHTIKHPDLTKLPYEEQYKELAASKAAIEEVTQNKVTYFRPPFGQYNADTIRVARQLGLITVMWRVASIDWELKDNPEQIITNVTENLEDGSIILLHELKQTLEVLPGLIEAIKAKGYTFSSLQT